ncbi:MAG: twin-arginine translocase TatA/TatE family subunit [Propionibacteriaceae bacterium]|nr:twin-arginine translocase TatA/TatE family subunit [Propionibacteriaceae bacterium]
MTLMFLDIGMAELLVICVLVAVVFGPDKIPPMVKKVSTVINFLRGIANDATDQLKAELGEEFSDLPLDGLNVSDLNPKSLVNSVLGEEISSLEHDVGGELIALRDEMNAMRTEVTKLRLQAGAHLIPPRPRPPVLPPPAAPEEESGQN